MSIENAAVSPQSRSPLKWLIRLILGAGLVLLLWRGVAKAPLGPALSRATPPVFVVAIALYLVGQAISVWRWRALLNANLPCEKRVGFWEMARWYGAGMFWNLWMPTGIGGDAIRAVRAGNRIGSLRVGAASVLLDRVVGVIGLLLIAIFALSCEALRGADAADTSRAAQIVLQVLAGTLALIGALLWSARKPMRTDYVADNNSWRQKISAKINALRATLADWTQPRFRATLLVSLLSSLLVQAVQIGINGWLAHAVGLSISWSVLAWLTPVLALSSLLPIGIGGLGVREAAAIGLLGNTQVAGTVLAWSLLWQATVWLSSLVGLPWAWQKAK